MKNASSNEPLEDMAHGDNLWPEAGMWNGAPEFVSIGSSSMAKSAESPETYRKRAFFNTSEVYRNSILWCASLTSEDTSYKMLALGKRIFPLLALALEVEEAFFEDKVC